MRPDLKPGQRVICRSQRANREQFFNQEGVIVNLIGSRRDIVYVRLSESLCPPFFEDELELLEVENVCADISTEKEVA